MIKLIRIALGAAMVTALLGLASPARAESCDKKNEHDLYCRVVGGCIAAGPQPVDPVVCG